MNNVEFLIQKEGDRAWLPLESPTVEVLEGRYHLVAQNNAGQAPAQIQIRHRYTKDGVLQEELEKKLLKPDDQGQLQILSSAYLGYGLWTISCTPINTGAQLNAGEMTSAAINLQVLEEDFDLISDWEFSETTQTFPNDALLSFPVGAQPLTTDAEQEPVPAPIFMHSDGTEELFSEPNCDSIDLETMITLAAEESQPVSLTEALTDHSQAPSEPVILADEALADHSQTTSEPVVLVEALTEQSQTTTEPVILAEDHPERDSRVINEESTVVITADSQVNGTIPGPAPVMDVVAASVSPETSAWTGNQQQPALPTLPKAVAKINLRPVQSSPLPPALAEIATPSVSDPQLPSFSRLSKWRHVPVEKLSTACRSQNIRPDKESNRAFAALELQQRFCQTLTQLAIQHRDAAKTEETSLLHRTTITHPQAVG